MPRPSCIDRLSQTRRNKLDATLIANGFSEYTVMAEQLRAEGYSKISKSALHRYGQELKKRIQIGRAQAQLAAAGIDAEMAAELTGDATLVVVIDRRNGRARLINLPMQAVEVINLLKGAHK